MSVMTERPVRVGGPDLGLWREVRSIASSAVRTWKLVPGSQRWALFLAVGIMSITSAANTAIPLLLGKLINSVEPGTHPGQSHSALLRIAGFYLALMGSAYFVRESMNVLRRYLVENVCTRIDRDMCVKLVSHLMKSDLATLAHQQVGALHGRIARSVEGVVRFFRISFLDFIPALLSGTFALTAALSQQPRVALAMVGVIPVSLTLTLWQLYTQKGIRLGLLRSREAMDGTIVEQLSGLDYVRAANTHEQEVHRIERAAERRRATELRHHFEMSLFGSGKALNEGFFHLVVIACAIYLFVNGGINAGEVITLSVLFLNVMAPLNEVHRFIDEAHESSLRMGDLLEILSAPQDISFLPAAPRKPILELGRPLIEAQELRVHYKTQTGKPRRGLEGLSVAINHGETIGVAGRSGCGKSTWLRVLMRLTHPCGGSATIGGVPLDAIDRATIGDLIGYVGQNPFVFAGTIGENIAYGREDASEAEIERAARLACIHDEIIEMPGGYRAAVTERGQNLSGGQRQRLALARVFLKNPPILVLDEGTSALDNINERKVQQAINAARADRTVILVAHRLSTLYETDRILVFDEGRIVETGTYDELVRLGGVFTELVHSAEGEPSTEPIDAVAYESLALEVSSAESIVAAADASSLTAASNGFLETVVQAN